MATPLSTGVLAIQDGDKTVQEEPREWYYKNTEGIREGPFLVDELKELTKELDGKVPKLREDTLVLCEGVADWTPLRAIRTLRWRLLMHNQPELTPRRVCLICCEILYRLSCQSPSKDSKGNPIRPLPRVKAMLCTPSNLGRMCQLILTGEPQIVDGVCRLLEEVVVADRVVLQKLYITGVYFFLLAYGGSNFAQISSLLKATHLDQAFRADTATGQDHLTLGERSYLGVMLPESCIQVLTTYKPSAFAETFTGNFDNPEVIWKYDMRQHLMCMLWQHIGDFARRLSQNPYALYDFIPLPAVHFEVLANELWCHNFYLRTLCDSTRYADWPIKKPVELLQAVLDAWRDELSREAPSQTEAQARQVLEVGNDSSEEAIRQAYKKLARLYHPDKNPEGRDQFEQIQAAYDLLSATRVPTGEPDHINVVLILKTHSILYERHQKTLAPFKYPGYPMLLDVMRDAVRQLDDSEQLELLEVSSEALLLTVQASTGNAEEVIGEDGIQVISDSLHRCLENVRPETELSDPKMKIVIHLCKLLAVLSNIDNFRSQLLAHPRMVWDAVSCITFPHAVEAVIGVLDFIARCCVTNELQDLLVRGGALWRCMRLLFEYDFTMDEEQAKANVSKNTQAANNVYAIMACVAVGKLAGYLQVGSPMAPVNQDICIAVSCMLTGVLALRLKQPNCADLLQVLNTNVEVPTIIWNDLMRADLQAFLDRQFENVLPCEHSAKAAHSFSFAVLEKELYVGQLYVRVYNEQPTTQLENPDKVAIAMFSFLVESRKAALELDTSSNEFKEQNLEYLKNTTALAQALVNVMKHAESTAKVLESEDWLPLITIVSLLQDPAGEEMKLRDLVLQYCLAIADHGFAADGFVSKKIIWRLLYCMRSKKETRVVVLSILKALIVANNNSIEELVRFSSALDFIQILVEEELDLSLRTLAMSVAALMCNDPKFGPTTTIHFGKIIPKGLLDKICHDPQTGVQVYDDELETPELIWNMTCRTELTRALVQLTQQFKEMEAACSSPAEVKFKLPDSFYVKYSLHEDEVAVGGVFLRLFLKDPQFDLKDPKLFLEQMLSAFFEQWESQKQHTSEKYMDLVSAVVSILKTRPSLTDHISTLGYIPKLVQLLLEVEGEVRLIKETAVIRLFHEFASSDKCVERLASVPTTFQALLKVMKPYPHPLAFCLDTTKLLLERGLRTQPSLVPQVLDHEGIPFFLTILEEASIDHVDDPGAAKVHAIGCLQMMSRCQTHGEQVNGILDGNPIWGRYKNQKHDLFISRQQKKDYFLADGAASTTKLLTSGED